MAAHPVMNTTQGPLKATPDDKHDRTKTQWVTDKSWGIGNLMQSAGLHHLCVLQ
jgi:hypothetical protein